MTTGVVKGFEPTFEIAGDDDALIADLKHPVVAASGHVFGSADVEPALVPDRLQLPSVVVRIEIEPVRQTRLDSVECLSVCAIHLRLSNCRLA